MIRHGKAVAQVLNTVAGNFPIQQLGEGFEHQVLTSMCMVVVSAHRSIHVLFRKSHTLIRSWNQSSIPPSDCTRGIAQTSQSTVVPPNPKTGRSPLAHQPTASHATQSHYKPSRASPTSSEHRAQTSSRSKACTTAPASTARRSWRGKPRSPTSRPPAQIHQQPRWRRK